MRRMTSLKSWVKVVLMKKLSLYIFLVLVFCNLSANAKDKCDVSKPIYNWTMCLGTQIDNQNKFKYVGEWKDGVFHGQGTWTHKSGEEYVGEWKFGKRSGQGSEIFPDGFKYVGEFKSDRRNGQGTSEYIRGKWKGEKYVGEWKSDKRHGQGTLILANGKKKSGVWQDDQLLTKQEEKKGRNYVYEYALNNENAFSKQDPSTFKKLIFIKKEKIGDVSNDRNASASDNDKKKTFRSFSFIAEYEDNITVELLIEHRKNKGDLKKAEIKASYFANMYGRMPHFLKTYNKKIYIHEDRGKDDGTWWVMYNKKEFHVNESLCQNMSRFSLCSEVMVHELAHVIQQLTGVISPSKWGQARKLDNKKYCSKYAKKNSNEDFAESMVCWIGVKYKSSKIKNSKIIQMNKFIPNRFKFFDEMNFNMYPYKN